MINHIKQLDQGNQGNQWLKQDKQFLESIHQRRKSKYNKKFT